MTVARIGGSGCPSQPLNFCHQIGADLSPSLRSSVSPLNSELQRGCRGTIATQRFPATCMLTMRKTWTPPMTQQHKGPETSLPCDYACKLHSWYVTPRVNVKRLTDCVSSQKERRSSAMSCKSLPVLEPCNLRLCPSWELCSAQPDAGQVFTAALELRLKASQL